MLASKPFPRTKNQNFVNTYFDPRKHSSTPFGALAGDGSDELVRDWCCLAVLRGILLKLLESQTAHLPGRARLCQFSLLFLNGHKKRRDISSWIPPGPMASRYLPNYRPLKEHLAHQTVRCAHSVIPLLFDTKWNPRSAFKYQRPISRSLSSDTTKM